MLKKNGSINTVVTEQGNNKIKVLLHFKIYTKVTTSNVNGTS